MGILFRILGVTSEDYDAFSGIDINFATVEPTPEEVQLHNDISPIIENLDPTLKQISCYSGASDLIRNAISHPDDPEILAQTLSALQPNLVTLKHFYEFSLKLNDAVIEILKTLCEEEDFYATIARKPATTKKMGQIIEFCMLFDEKKGINPAVQNDLSFFKRMHSRGKLQSMSEEEPVLTHEESALISLFLSSHTPCFFALTERVKKAFTSTTTPSLKSVTVCLSTIIKLCQHMLGGQDLADPSQAQNKMFLMRLLVGFIILFDHIDEFGAFSKNTTCFDAKHCIKVIKDASQLEDTRNLLNTIRYTSKHFNDPTTPSSVKEMLES